jgi:hypothetical protein
MKNIILLISLLFASCASTNEPVIRPDGDYVGNTRFTDDNKDGISFLNLEVKLISNEDTVIGIGSYDPVSYTMDIAGYLVNDSIFFEYYDCLGGLTKCKGKITKHNIKGTFVFNFSHLNRFGEFSLLKVE